jgi:glycosyltransferase involved in cell wall biosynthesis
MRIMHVVEALGGGVQSAINYWTSETPEHCHVVLGVRRDRHQTNEVPANHCYIELPPGHTSRLLALAQHVKRLRPEIIHAHSSLAGAYARLNPLIHGVPIVYSPHCFAFERTDLSRPQRQLLRFAESAMSLRTSAYLTVSRRETSLTQDLWRVRPAREVAVFRPPPDALPLLRPHRGDTSHMVAVGRVDAQKDPSYMAEAMAIVHERFPEVTLTWVGDGDPVWIKMLRGAGFKVTGWLDRADVTAIIRSADVFLHSAAWEGSPVVIEEALAAGVPIVARRIPVLEDRMLPLLADSPPEMAELTIGLLSSASVYHRVQQESRRAAAHGPQAAGPVLRQIYGLFGGRE